MKIEVKDGKIKGYETTKEFGERLGVRDVTVRQWIKRGLITPLKIGDMNWVKNGTPRPTNKKG